MRSSVVRNRQSGLAGPRRPRRTLVPLRPRSPRETGIACANCAIFKRAGWPAVVALGGCFSMSPAPPDPAHRPSTRWQRWSSRSSTAPRRPAPRPTGAPDATFVTVHPTLDQRDVGWFIFDTGASAWTISDTGAAGPARRHRPRADRRKDRRPSTRAVVWTLDRWGSRTSAWPGSAWATRRRPSVATWWASAETTFRARRSSKSMVAPPAGASRPVWATPAETEWHPLVMCGNLPLVRCRYARAEGLFLIDTGSNGSIHLFLAGDRVPRAAARALHGFKDADRLRRSAHGRCRMAGGLPRRRSVDRSGRGHLRARRRADLRSRPEADGIIGMRVLRDHVVLIDERAGRAWRSSGRR